MTDTSISASFFDKVRDRAPGIVTYGMTPPKVGTEAGKLPTLAATHRERIMSLPVNAVIVYDIHDEKDRTPNSPRPFPFSATLDGVDWAELMGDVGRPYIHFRCIAKYGPDEFQAQLSQRLSPERNAVVIVGGSAASQQLSFTMNEAYVMRQQVASALPLGAVAIPERHATKQNEHERMWQKQTEGGVSFFVTQCVYNLEEAKNMLSDYHALCKRNGTPMVPILVTLTPCGSAKTLEFLRWLGVKVSKWLENDLLSANEEGQILEESVDALLHLFRELQQFAKRKGIPLGCNVESVAIRKVEIEASMKLVREIRRMLDDDVLAAPIA